MRQSRRSTLQRQTDDFRERVLRMEAASTQILSAAYADVLAQLEPRILALAEQIAEAKANGEEVGISWLFQLERYQELRRQIIVLMDGYGLTTKMVTTEAQKVITRQALLSAGEMLLPVSGGSGGEIVTLARGWAAVPDATVVEMVGAMQQGTPVDAVIRSYGVDSVQQVNQALVRGMALGDSARQTAAVLRALGITRARAESLVRTETLRAARTATLAAYTQSGVVRGWRWSASLSARTCAACLAMSGRVFPLTQPPRMHINCRCSCSPVLINEPNRAAYLTGAQWLAQQPVSVQQQVLGISGQQAYAAGDVELDDFVALHKSKDWGDSYVDGGIGFALKQASSGRKAA